MTVDLRCPTCDEGLHTDGNEGFRCPEDHRYTFVELALTTNVSALRALWMAIRALEDDAGSLRYLAKQLGDKGGMSADERLHEAEATLDAAQMLRRHAQRAQERLDRFPWAPSAVRETDSQRGRSG